jgi:chromosome segregation ATPase
MDRETLEVLRLEEINALLSAMRSQYKLVSSEWSRLARRKKELAAQVKSLEEEQESLAQGQLMFRTA